MPTALSIVRDYFPNVTEVNDATGEMDIEVTNPDVLKATRKSHRTCAMAVACKRKMKLDGVIISVRTAYTIKGNVATRFKLPESVSREVISYDRGSGFAPGEYKLQKPDHKLGTRELNGNGHRPRGRGNGLKNARHFTTGIRTVLGAKNIA